MPLSSFDARLFAAIADQGGISAAARHLGLQKSVVSRDLAALEDRLGTRLVHRSTRSLSLTDAGTVLAAYARRAVEELDNGEAAIQSLREAPRGELRVTLPNSMLRLVLAPRLAAFTRAHPDLRLSIDASGRMVDLVHEGYDLAIRVGDLPDSGLIARRLAETPLILVASPDYACASGLPAVPEALASAELITFGQRAAPAEWRLDGPIPWTGRLTPRAAVGDPGIAIDLAIAGMGVALAPLIHVSAALKEGALVRVLPDYVLGTRVIHALYPSRRLLTPKVRAFIDFVAGCLDGGSAVQAPSPTTGGERP